MADNNRQETNAQLEHVERGVAHSQHEAQGRWASVRHKFRKAFAEFLGTAILVAFGSGAVAQLIFSANSSWFTMCLGWGFGLTFGIYVAGGISGAHLNPAVTLAQVIFRGFPLIELPIYWISQFLGAFLGAVIVYITNYASFQANETSSTIGIFITGRQTDNVSTAAAFAAELFGTAFLVLVILSTSDKGNTPAGNVQPLIIGFSLAAIGNSFGYETGFALNPARDFAPRVFTAIAGWGAEAFTRQEYYFWVPIVAPFVGAIAGAFIYDTFVYTKGPGHLNN